jgi:hypothetical protein
MLKMRILTISLTTLVLSIHLLPARAIDWNDINEAMAENACAAEEASEEESDDWEQTLEQLGDWLEFYGNLNEILSGNIGPTQMLDMAGLYYEQINEQMPEEGLQSSEFENGLEDSYAIKKALASQNELGMAKTTLSLKSLDKDAQEETKKSLEKSNACADESQELAEDSQNSDTSQQILQNISFQMAKESEISWEQRREMTEVREQQAVNGAIAAQAAETAAQHNTAERQQLIAAKNDKVAGWGLISVPGNAILHDDGEEE